jgi:hypothetical protein
MSFSIKREYSNGATAVAANVGADESPFSYHRERGVEEAFGASGEPLQAFTKKVPCGPSSGSAIKKASLLSG